jgi:hypothetical protein
VRRAGGNRAARLTFFVRERLDTLRVNAVSDVSQGRFAVTFASRLSVVTAYLAFAFVGAIVLGVI